MEKLLLFLFFMTISIELTFGMFLPKSIKDFLNHSSNEDIYQIISSGSMVKTILLYT